MGGICVLRGLRNGNPEVWGAGRLVALVGYTPSPESVPSASQSSQRFPEFPRVPRAQNVPTGRPGQAEMAQKLKTSSWIMPVPFGAGR